MIKVQSFIIENPDLICKKCGYEATIGLESIQQLLLKFGLPKEDVYKVTNRDIIQINFCNICNNKNDTIPEISILKDARCK